MSTHIHNILILLEQQKAQSDYEEKLKAGQSSEQAVCIDLGHRWTKQAYLWR